MPIGQIVYIPDKANPAKSSAYDLSVPLKQALQDFIAAQQVQTGTDAQGRPTFGPKYRGIADLLFTHLADGLFATVVDNFPPANVVSAKATLATDQATLNSRKAAHIAKVSVADPS